MPATPTRAAAELGGRNRSRARPRRAGARRGSEPAVLPGRGHRRRHPDRRTTARASAICRAPTAYGFESTSTFQFDPIGWKGAKLDLTFGYEWTSVRDPLTHEKRPISGNSGSVGSRPDSPRHSRHTPFAWSAYVQSNHYTEILLPDGGLPDAQDIPWIVGLLRRAQERDGPDRRASASTISSTAGTRSIARRLYRLSRSLADLPSSKSAINLSGHCSTCR